MPKKIADLIITTDPAPSDLIPFSHGASATDRGLPVSYFDDKIQDVDDKSPYISVKEYGAIGDGATDDTGVIQTAITNAPAGARLLFPPGKVYKVDQLVVTKEIHFEMTGSHITSSYEDTAGQEDIYPIISATSGAYKFTITGGKISYTGAFYTVAPNPDTVDAVSGRSGVWADCDEFQATGVTVTGCNRNGIRTLINCKAATLINCDCSKNGYAGVNFLRSGNCAVFGGIYNRNGDSNLNDGYGVIGNVRDSKDFKCIGATANQNKTRGIDTHRGERLIVIGNHCENNGRDALLYDDTTDQNGQGIRIRGDGKISDVIISSNYVTQKTGQDDCIAIGVGQDPEVAPNIEFVNGVVSGNVLYHEDDTSTHIFADLFKTESLLIDGNDCSYPAHSAEWYSIHVTSQVDDNAWMGKLTITNNITNGVIRVRNRGNRVAPTKYYIKIANNTCHQVSHNDDGTNKTPVVSIFDNDVEGGIIETYGLAGKGDIRVVGNYVDSFLVTTETDSITVKNHANAVVSNNEIHNAARRAILSENSIISYNRVYNALRLAGVDALYAITSDEKSDIIYNTMSGDTRRFIRANSISLTDVIRDNKYLVDTVQMKARADMSAYGLSSSILVSSGVFTIDPENRLYQINNTAKPTLGRYAKGAVIKNTDPAAGGYYSWITIKEIDKETTGTTAEAGTTIHVDTSGMNIADVIGIILDNETYHWTTIATIVDGTSLTIDDAIPAGRSVASGALVFARLFKGMGVIEA